MSLVYELGNVKIGLGQARHVADAYWEVRQEAQRIWDEADANWAKHKSLF